MSVVKMQKIRLVGLKEDKEAIVKKLQEAEIIHLKDFQQGALDEYFSPDIVDAEERRISEEIARIEAALSYLEQFNDKKTAIESFFPVKIETDEETREKTLKSFDYKRAVKEIGELREKAVNIEEKISSLHSGIAFISPFKDLSWPPSQAKETTNTVSLFLKGPKEKQATVTRKLDGAGANHVEIISKDTEHAHILLICWKQDAEGVLSILKAEGFEELNLASFDKKPSDIIDSNKKKIETLYREKENFKKRTREMLKNRDALMVACDWLRANFQRETSKKVFRESERIFVLQGWIRKNDKNHIEEFLKAKFPATYIEDVLPDKDEAPPVEIKNNIAVRPFQGITKLFGLPRFGEIDPTALIAPFFFVFFGLCLTDAGYGIVLVALTLFAMKKIKVGAEGKQFFRLFLLGGVATIFWGIITGGWFGIEAEKLPQFLKSAILINPLDSLMKFFLLALIFGLVHIFVGIGVEAYEQLRERNFASAFADQFSFLVILPGAILWAASTQIDFFQKFDNLGLSIMIIGLAIMAFGSFFKKGKNPFIWFIIGLGAIVWKAKDFLSNVLSYSRLMALGLATSIIALVINILAGIAMEQIPYFGVILAILIIVGGHLFNIAINTLGAFVHTTRLHFVEFFSYFFQGGGEAFAPLSRESKYVITNEYERGR